MKNNEYEDEIDRMRARRLAARTGHSGGRPTDSSCTENGQEPEIVDLFDDGEPAVSSSVRRTGTGRTLSGEVRRELVRRKAKKRRHFLLGILILFAVLAAGLFSWFSMSGSGYWTVAVYGVDSRSGSLGKGALSDVEMLCSINRRSGEIRLLSVFRDSYLMISDGNYNKINEAYFLGGHDQATEALETNFDIQVDDYAAFNWKSVADAINLLGGVDLEITDKEFAYINSFITETAESTGVASVHLEHSGMNHLDGVQAVAYARLRLMDTDFNRTERQRKVLGLVMEKLKQANAGTLTSLAGTVFPQISTSIGLDDLLKMAKNSGKYYISETSGFPFSHQEMNVGKMSCVIPTTLESNVVQLHAFLYDDGAYEASQTVRNISAEIAETTGLGEPGKDTESGKNVGAQGNSSDGSILTAPTETASETVPAVSETPAGGENEENADAVTEASESETAAEMPETASAETEEQGSSFDEPVTVPSPETEAGVSETPAEVAPGPGPDGPSAGAANQGQNASLEAPGQHAAETEEGLGPGV